MEFKFRAVDDRQISYVSPSSGIGQSSTIGPGSSYSLSTIPAVLPIADFPINEGPTRNPNELQDFILRERIREEIIAVEIAKRRVLEAEVRRELAYLEREMAMRRGAPEGSSLEDQWAAMRFESRLPLAHAVDERLPFPTRSGACDVSPWHSDTFACESNPGSHDKFIVLAKPNLNISGAKRKAVEPPIVDAGPVHSFDLKKPREEWSCALCQFSATSERELNEHLEGEKHKTSEIELRAQRKLKNSNTPLKKKKRKLSKAMESNGTACSVLDANVRDELMKDNEINGAEMVQTVEKTAELKNKNNFKFWCELCQVGAYHAIVMEDHKKGKRHREFLQLTGSDRKTENAIVIESKSEELLMQKLQNEKKSTEINGAEIDQGVEKATGFKNMKNFKFWCDKCQFGAYLEKVMDEHLKGKRHRKSKGVVGRNENSGGVESKSEELLIPKFGNAGKFKEKNVAEMVVQGVDKAEHKKENNLKLWCELCQVGTHSVIVMEDHKRGKRHFLREKAIAHQEINQQHKPLQAALKSDDAEVQTQKTENQAALKSDGAGFRLAGATGLCVIT